MTAGHAFSTGMIARASFERMLAPTRMKPGFANNVGCKPEVLAEPKRNGALVPDDFEHDHLIPMHYSGEAFIAIAMQEMPTKVLRSSTGTRLLFG